MWCGGNIEKGNEREERGMDEGKGGEEETEQLIKEDQGK